MEAIDRPDALFHEARQRFEEQFIRDALEKTGGNISQAAQQIQLGRRNLQRKIKQFGIDVSQYSRRPLKATVLARPSAILYPSFRID